ncbi:hypothetical protein AVEN_120619-1 [Araneus ventricosus]|uniref:STPR domain-containing protein n=1 Tax=Araneus ventricosus TaxID=182803 RepID=A0A4Y2TWW2_ARAVE|nr:hypothetical protein AVEN_120619-1 [Araneus ventricosus]
MLPVDSRQLENLKGELLKLKKKEIMAQRSLDRRAEETEGQRNSRLSAMKETADFQLWQKVARTEETEEQNNSLLTVMAQRDQKRRAEETEKQRNRGLSDMAQRGQERKAEETEEQRNSRLSDMAQRSQERRAEENRRAKEWPIGQARRVT